MPDPQVIKALPTILERLKATYPDARYELNWDTPLQLLVATILAAQCTDERVNQVTPDLFAKYPEASDYANAPIEELEQDLKQTGFYRQKARTVQDVCKALVERFAGEVPQRIDDLITLPRVARKTANVVLNNHFRIPSGVIVDTHVQRVSQRMGLTDQKKPDKIEVDLMELIPREEWVQFGPAMVLLGRYTCTHHDPDCVGCVMADLCPKLLGDEDEADEAGTDGTPDESPAEEDSPPMATKKAPKTATKKKPEPARSKAAPARAAAPAAPAVKSLKDMLPADWQVVLSAEFDKPYFKQLEKFVAAERAGQTIYPPEEDMFNAFKGTPYDKVKVLLLGQDPYHGPGQAHGLCFSVKPGVKPPPSLVNMYKELKEDLGFDPVAHGCLTSWANQGVMLLNTVLTVRAGEANSHKEKGWETFTDAVIQALNNRDRPMVALLWGGPAQKKAVLLDQKKHRVILSGHPSPLSASKFFGTKPYSSANRALQDLGQSPVNWQLPADPSAALPGPAPAAGSDGTAATPARASKPASTRSESPKPAPVVVKEPPTVLEGLLPEDWRAALEAEFRKPYFKNLDKFLSSEFESGGVFPAKEDLFRAFHLAPLKDIRAVILGTEPPGDGTADGLALSVREGEEPTPYLEALFTTLREELGCRIPVGGSLAPWARQGVLLLNTLLTARATKQAAHKGKGWEPFVEAVIQVLNAQPRPIVFVLWGREAQKLQGLIDRSRHPICAAENPEVTPGKFADAQPFTAINDALELNGRSRIHWQLPYV